MPISRRDPLGLVDNPAEMLPFLPTVDLPIPSQDFVNAGVGLGDGVIAALTFGRVSGQDVRNLIPYTRGSNGGAQACSAVYRGARAFGALDAVGAQLGAYAVAASANTIRGVVASLGLMTGGAEAASVGADLEELPNLITQLEDYVEMAEEEGLSKPIAPVPGVPRY
jgi:hypothetical protein